MDLPELFRTAPDTAAHGVTVGDYATKFLAVLGPGAQRTYRTPLRFLCDGWSVPESQIDLVREVAAKFAADCHRTAS